MPDQDFQISGPITAERAQRATEWLVHSASVIARLKGERDRAEYMIKITRAFGFERAEGSAAARDAAALTSSEYANAVEDHVRCVIAHEEALGLRRAAENVIEVWRSLNSNLRKAP